MNQPQLTHNLFTFSSNLTDTSNVFQMEKHLFLASEGEML